MSIYLLVTKCRKRRLPQILLVVCWLAAAAEPNAAEIVEVEGQPLAANVTRLVQSLNFLGAPLPAELQSQLVRAINHRDAQQIQELLQPQVLFEVSINPELRVKVDRGSAKAELQQGGFQPVIVRIINHGTVSSQLKMVSRQGGAVYSGAALGILKRQAQTELNTDENTENETDRFLAVDMFQKPPMLRNLSGLEVEYAIGLIYCSEAGKREATIGFDIGAGGNQDIGFRGEVPVLFEAKPAVPVRLSILDHDGKPTTAKLTIRDSAGRIHPPQSKRLAPDFFFQPQIYRRDREILLLPPGDYTVQYSRGPEYIVRSKNFSVQEKLVNLNLRLERWIETSQFGFYSGDHHIHGAGCSHYESPTQGVTPEDMFAQVKGEGLNVGCVLTWGPCFDFQRQYFAPDAKAVSEPLTLIKYDLEISGFGSAALGHVCLLNLQDQTYPGSEGTSTKGWPTWTVPVLRWAKEQGGVTGFPHSAFSVDAELAADELLALLDRNQDGLLQPSEVSGFLLLPETFSKIDHDKNAEISKRELVESSNRAANELPNVALPNMNGRGALEICVSVAEGVCDFVSAMDTSRIPEWNTWYHLMNCGFPVKVSGETDFPCMSSRRVGQGRVYVQLGTNIEKLNFSDWCKGLGEGRSYVSDGFAHAVHFSVNKQTPGNQDVHLSDPDFVTVSAQVAFAEEVPEGVAFGNQMPASGRRTIGDTVNLHAPRSDRMISGGTRLVEVVVNGKVVAQQNVPANNEIHDLKFSVPIDQSSWVALRHFPQLHTNPVNVLVDEKPIRASKKSALWCAETVRMLWDGRNHRIRDEEKKEAKAAYDRAIRRYQQIAMECLTE